MLYTVRSSKNLNIAYVNQQVGNNIVNILSQIDILLVEVVRLCMRIATALNFALYL